MSGEPLPPLFPDASEADPLRLLFAARDLLERTRLVADPDALPHVLAALRSVALAEEVEQRETGGGEKDAGE